MTSYALLVAGLLGTTAVYPSAVSPAEQEPRKEIVIPFTWQLTEKWRVEIRGYRFRRGLPPKLQTFPWNLEWREYREHRWLPPSRAVEVITIDKLVDVSLPRVEPIRWEYSPDLRAQFEKAKNQKR